MNQYTLAYREGAKAAKNGNNISNCFPFNQGRDLYDWTDGYNSIKPEAKMDRDMLELSQKLYASLEQ